jgi:dihydroorotase
MIALETALTLSCMHLAAPLGWPTLVRVWAEAPRQILGLSAPEIREGTKAELTVFDPSLSWVLQPDMLRSRSRNTPFLGANLRGKSIGIISQGQSAGK